MLEYEDLGVTKKPKQIQTRVKLNTDNYQPIGTKKPRFSKHDSTGTEPNSGTKHKLIKVVGITEFFWSFLGLLLF